MKKLLALTTLVLTTLGAFAQGTAFTYQGRLNNGTNAANGSHDFTFAVFDTASGGVSGSGTITNAAVAVSNGLFTTTLDFGNAPDGVPAWLEIAVRTNGAGAFTTLNPRQPILPTPYAMFATTASNLVGNVALAQLPASVLTNGAGGVNLTGAFTGNGAGVTNVNAASLNGLNSSNFWQLNGNNVSSTQFLGSTNNQPLEFKVNGLRALRLENNGDSTSDSGTAPDGAPNMIGGSPGNFVGAGVVGATIAGGGATNFGGTAYTNSVLADFGVVGGGRNNTIAADSQAATIAGGSSNDIGTNSDYSAIGGGENNNIATDSQDATIAGGIINDIGTNSTASAIGGGKNNNIAANSRAATIAGGNLNDIGTNSFESTVGGGYDNNISTNSQYATIAGGVNNDIGTNSNYSAIGGGYDNNIAADNYYATIASGGANNIGKNSGYSSIGGGSGNNIASNSSFATIPGGLSNTATNNAFAAGSSAKATNSGAFVWSDSTGTTTGSVSNNSVTMRASGGYRFFTQTGAAGAQLLANATAWSVMSDRNVKKDFAAVDSVGILEKLAAMPVTQWHYNWEEQTVTPHIGPMAQDFKHAFYPGSDDKSISTLEADGVAFAAIQGLNEKVEVSGQKSAVRSQQSESRIQKLETENAELKSRLEKLEQLFNTQGATK